MNMQISNVHLEETHGFVQFSMRVIINNRLGYLLFRYHIATRTWSWRQHIMVTMATKLTIIPN